MKRSFRSWIALSVLMLMAACGGGGDGTDDPSRSVTGSSTDRPARLSVSSTQATGPVAPFTANGWYWNPAEGGTGFMFEAQGTRAFVGFFMYEEGSGKPIWYVATGDLTNGDAAGDHRFSGDLRVYHGGMGLSDRVRTSPTSQSVGTVGIDFVGGRAIVALPGGRVMNAERFCAGGPCVANPKPPTSFPAEFIAETGWYWNPDEGGRGFAIETYNGSVFMGVFHYNPDGSPVWHVSSFRTTDSDRGAGLELYTGGQSLTSDYRNPSGRVVATIGLRFPLPYFEPPPAPCSGSLNLSGNPSISLRRFVIDGSTQPAGFECRALAGLADVPDVGAPKSMRVGDLVYGVIDGAGDADAYRVDLYPGTYTFDLLGASSGSGTLQDPMLSLLDRSLAQITENDDRSLSSTDARITYTIASSGTYLLRVRSSSKQAGSGSFLLKITPDAPTFNTAPASAYKGIFTGKLLGPELAYVTLQVGGDGRLTGTLTYQGAKARRVYLGGGVAAGGLLTIEGVDFPYHLSCKASLLNYGDGGFSPIFGSCGDFGMLVGSHQLEMKSKLLIEPVLATVGQPVQMASMIPAADPALYQWDFGDGSTAPGSSAQAHAYSSPGIYQVSLLQLLDFGDGPRLSWVRETTTTLTVVCADGTICTDFEEPAPWTIVDSVRCELEDYPPSIREYAKGPAIAFEGRARVPSDYIVLPVATRDRLLTEEAFYSLFKGVGGILDPLEPRDGKRGLRASCNGRRPCLSNSGPITTFASIAEVPGQTYYSFGSQPARWLYVAVMDRFYTKLHALTEKEMSCPAPVPRTAATPP